MTKFNDLGLKKDLVKGLDELGFVEASSIQEKAIPFLMSSKKDLIALAQTGTGKTAAFSLPIIDKLNIKAKKIQAIVICPTRELCLQISEDISTYSKYMGKVNTVAVYGGERIDLQIKKLKKGANIVVGTPGRLHDLIRRKVLKLDEIEYLVLDEADEMLDMGFKEDLDAILEETPEKRQTLLFSATISASVRRIAKEYMKEVEEIKVGEENSGSKNVSHEYYVVNARDRYETLERLIDSIDEIYGIVFCRTRMETQVVSDKLKQSGYNAEALHGDISQNNRTKIMNRFKKKNISLLVATDVAARGIDVNNLSHVINYNLPDQNEAYTHRSGRTGRAGSEGVSISICGLREKNRIKELEKRISKEFEFKKVPSGDEILELKVSNYVKKIQSHSEESDNSDYFSGAVESLKKIKKDDLLRFVFQEKFSRLIENKSLSRDLNASFQKTKQKMSGADSSILKLNLGKKHGIEIKNIFEIINSNKQSKGTEVGRVIVNQGQSLVSVKKNEAKKLVQVLNNSNFRGKKILFEISHEEIPKSRRSRSGPRRAGARQSRQRTGRFRKERKRY